MQKQNKKKMVTLLAPTSVSRAFTEQKPVSQLSNPSFVAVKQVASNSKKGVTVTDAVLG